MSTSVSVGHTRWAVQPKCVFHVILVGEIRTLEQKKVVKQLPDCCYVTKDCLTHFVVEIFAVNTNYEFSTWSARHFHVQNIVLVGPV